MLFKLSKMTSVASKSRIIFVLSATLALSNIYTFKSEAESLKDGNYKIPIKLIKKYDEETSMGNAALVQYGFVTVKSGKIDMKVRFIPLDFMNFRGYLSNLSIEGKKVSILSRYDEYDSYNDPQKGTDKLFKGIKYPKDMSFPLKFREKELPVKVYVPVMAELGSGNQDARLKIEWPENIEKNRVKDNNFEKKEGLHQLTKTSSQLHESIDKRELPQLPKGEKIKLDNGYYSVDVKLYHERENKESMGNKAMMQKADIVAKNGKYHMLIGSRTMTVQNITASLVSLQIRNDKGVYHFADPYAFDLKVEGDPEKRPEVFEFELERMDPMIYVKVDPKVKPMGEKPVGARLQIDWSSLEKVEEDKARLVVNKKNGTPEPKFNTNKKIDITIDGIQYIAEPGTFDERATFKSENITGGIKYINIVNEVGRDTPLIMYKFKAENRYGQPVKILKPVKINMTLPDNMKNVYVRDVDTGKTIPSSISGKKIEITMESMGEIAVISREKINKESVGSTSLYVVDKNGKIKKSTLFKKTPKSELNTGQSFRKNKKGEAVKSILKNDNTDFSEESEIKSEHKTLYDKNTENTQTSDSNKMIIFSSIIALLSLIAISIAVYVKIGKKLVYEMKVSEELRKRINLDEKKSNERRE